MARTANTGFYFRKHLLSSGAAPEPIRIRLANSATVRVGDMLRINSSGFGVTTGVSSPVLGPVLGLVDNNGINPFSLGYDTTVPGVTLTNQDQITTNSANQTSNSYMSAEVALDPGGQMLFYNKANGNLAQSNVGQFFNLTSNGQQVDQGTPSDTTGVVQLISLDPDNDGDATKGLFRIATNQLLTQVGNGTAVRSA